MKKSGSYILFDKAFASLRLCVMFFSRKARPAMPFGRGAKAQRGRIVLRISNYSKSALLFLFIINSLFANAQDILNRKAAIDSTFLGVEYYANENIDDAIQMFTSALKSDSTYDEARYRRANAYYEQNNYKLARNDYQWLVNHHIKNADVYERLGDMDTATQNFKDALPLFSEAIAIDSTQGSYFAARGLTFFYFEKYENASIDLNKAVDLNYTSADLYSKLGYAKLRTGDNKSAALYFTKAIDANPKNYEDYANRGDALVALHLLDEAKEDLLYYMKYDSTDYSVWYNLARADYGLKQYDSSIASYKKVISLKPGYGDTYFRLALVYGDKGDYKNAVNSFDNAIREYPKDAYLYYNRAIAKARLNDGSDYCADLKIAADMDYELAINMMKKVCK